MQFANHVYNVPDDMLDAPDLYMAHLCTYISKYGHKNMACMAYV